MEQNLKANKQINYTYLDYVKRLIWSIVNSIIWPLLWHKIPYLQMILLNCFGAKVFKGNLIYGSVKILRPWDFEMGEYSAIGSRVHVYNLGKISIGKKFSSSSVSVSGSISYLLVLLSIFFSSQDLFGILPLDCLLHPYNLFYFLIDCSTFSIVVLFCHLASSSAS